MDFTREQRNIFEYFNGIEMVKGDPLEIVEIMTHLLGMHPNEVQKQMGWIEEVTLPDGTAKYVSHGQIGLPALEASRKYWEAVERAFEMPPFDKATGIGADRTVKQAAVAALAEFLQKKSSNAGLWPTSSPPLA